MLREDRWSLRDTGRAPARIHEKRDPRSRYFVAWDGEGITYPGDTVQSYVLLGNSLGMRVVSRSLSTAECFDLLLSAERRYPDAIHVGFALQYDCNMMFRDIPEHKLRRIYATNRARWNGYRIEYRPGKWLSLSDGTTTMRLYDVFGFFQSSFVEAVRRFLGETPELQAIIEGKRARKTFHIADLDSFIIPYWKGELALLVRVMDALRDDLISAGININSWHGPGAVANAVFRREGIKSVKEETPIAVNRAAQYAYAGGRFELFKCGHYEGKVYEYDINSAYPSAIRWLPNLARGEWERVRSFEAGTFGVWKVAYSDSGKGRWTKPHPFFCRTEKGHVVFQDFVVGWYWSPEAEMAPESVLGGYVFRSDNSQPFAFVEEMYETRRQWKREGNSAERAYKLALNSLYGKMAQRIGWEEGRPLPAWHQLEWAGYVTSSTRAKIWEAIQQNPDAIIAVETDAVFSTEPLDLPTGSALGEWECETFDWITYLQNGVYWAGKDGEIIERYRGYDKGSLLYPDIVEALAWRPGDEGRPRLSGTTSRFVGMGIGLNTSAEWRSWETTERELVIGGGGKRKHVPRFCAACKSGHSFYEALHDLVITSGTGRSHPHSLPWRVGAEAELREIDERERW